MGQSCNFDIFNLELFGHRLAVSTISAISSVTAIILNSLVLYSIWKTPSLHKPSYILIANLALTDLIAGAIVQPLQIMFNVAVLMKWKNMFCSTWLGGIVFGYLVGSVSLYTMVLISVDRLLAIKLKNKYQGVVTLKRTSSAIIFGWIGGGSVVTTTIFQSNISQSKLIIIAAVYQTLMLTILTVCYSMAYHSLKKLSSSVSSRTTRNGTSDSNLQISSSISSSTTRNKATNSEQHHCPSSSISSSTARNKTSPDQHRLSSSISSSTARNQMTSSEQHHCPSSSISSSTARNKTIPEQHRPLSSISSSTARNKTTSSEQNLLSSSVSSSTARNKAMNSEQHRLSVLNSAPEETATSNQRAFNVIKYRRSLNTMLLVLLCMLLSYLPLVFGSILLAATMTDGLNFGKDSSSVLMYKIIIFSETFVLIASSVNPFLYIWRIKDLRQAVFLRFRKIFRREPPDNRRQQERS